MNTANRSEFMVQAGAKAPVITNRVNPENEGHRNTTVKVILLLMAVITCIPQAIAGPNWGVHKDMFEMDIMEIVRQRPNAIGRARFEGEEFYREKLQQDSGAARLLEFARAGGDNGTLWTDQWESGTRNAVLQLLMIGAEAEAEEFIRGLLAEAGPDERLPWIHSLVAVGGENSHRLLLEVAKTIVEDLATQRRESSAIRMERATRNALKDIFVAITVRGSAKDKAAVGVLKKETFDVLRKESQYHRFLNGLQEDLHEATIASVESHAEGARWRKFLVYLHTGVHEGDVFAVTPSVESGGGQDKPLPPIASARPAKVPSGESTKKFQIPEETRNEIGVTTLGVSIVAVLLSLLGVVHMWRARHVAE